MINFKPEQFVATQQANMDVLKGLTTQSFTSFEKMVELNMAASKALLGESFAHAQAMLAVKDAKELMDLQAGLLQPLTEKSVAYTRHVQAITSEAGEELSSALQARVVDVQAVVSQLVETVAKNAPAGTESAVDAMKNALTTSKTAMESAQATAKKALEMAEKNFNVATEQAVATAAKVSAKA